MTVLGSMVLLSGLAIASPHGSTFVAGKNQVALVTGASGHRSLSVTVSGDRALGAGVQADCELRAVESRRSWHLVSFRSDAMEVDAKDLRGVQVSNIPSSSLHPEKLDANLCVAATLKNELTIIQWKYDNRYRLISGR